MRYRLEYYKEQFIVDREMYLSDPCPFTPTGRDSENPCHSTENRSKPVSSKNSIFCFAKSYREIGSIRENMLLVRPTSIRSKPGQGSP